MTARHWIPALLCLGALALATPTHLAAGPTAPPSEPLVFETPEQEARYQKLVRELRCTVCQNQNLIESNAPLASDLRRQISLMVKDGAETGEVVDYMVARYGDFVLFRPPVNRTTYLLWYGPVILLVLGLSVLGLVLWRRKSRVTSAPLSADEEERLRRLLDEDRGGQA
ncbi:Cytochrome c heme lyase subunit CcmL [Thioalkalivibrio nitratireducens DSM 14787]|uniref:Cytochrome c-type biogenesis protein n=1 Tax=Thioalkalivibrio nitratireducens (strain DSM 14787 / UNIQEM 213 / ALEN2) TaxID=1255043 RepID=L0DXJ7_THIND|nr:cytochrome c-type biogenesis protein [Thioalkalivibrio nitratireducens]AGA33690.1 Cytochrome c heme lyase subunit CcmL [Thioalkalivibrio nitratireducens DSM 14787]